MFFSFNRDEIWRLDDIQQAYQMFLQKKMPLDFVALNEIQKSLLAEYLSTMEQLFISAITTLSPDTPPRFPFFHPTEKSSENPSINYKIVRDAPDSGAISFREQNIYITDVIAFKEGEFSIAPPVNSTSTANPAEQLKEFCVVSNRFVMELSTPSPRLTARFTSIMTKLKQKSGRDKVMVLELDSAFKADASTTSLVPFAKMATQLFQITLQYEIAQKLNRLKLHAAGLLQKGINVEALPLSGKEANTSYKFISADECSKIFFSKGYFIAPSCIESIGQLQGLLTEHQNSLEKLPHTAAYINNLMSRLINTPRAKQSFKEIEAVVVDGINSIGTVYPLADIENQERDSLFIALLLFSESNFLAVSRRRIAHIPARFTALVENLHSIEEAQAKEIFESCCNGAMQEQTQPIPATTDIALPASDPESLTSVTKSALMAIASRVPPQRCEALVRSLSQYGGIFSQGATALSRELTMARIAANAVPFESSGSHIVEVNPETSTAPSS